jgi:transcriptional regulator of arginine metabolism
MPSDREVRDRRRAAIREILLHDEPVHHQHDLVNRLRERGFAATQSNVSRDLRDIGAVRHEGQYMIPSWTPAEDSPFRKVVPFIRKLNAAGPHQLLLVTDPGAGPVVAQAIEDDQWLDLVGTVSGHSSVLLLTDNFLFQKLVYQRIRHYLGMEFVKLEGEDEDDGEEEAAAEEEEEEQREG